MPGIFRGKQRSLREHLLQSRALFGRSKNEPKADKMTTSFDLSQRESFLASTPASLKGSLLKNRLDNPLFRQLGFNHRRVTHKKNNSIVHHDLELEIDDNESTSSNELQVEGEERFLNRSVAIDSRATKRHYSVRRNQRVQNFKPKRESRFGNFLFTGKIAVSKRKKTLKKSLRKCHHLSDHSTSSGDSLSSHYDNESEQEVELLTQLEGTFPSSSDTSVDSVYSSPGKSFLLYTDKGQAVRVQFFFDHLLISPISSRMLLGYRSTKTVKHWKPRIIYYEDLISWTNNNDCLRLIHIRNKQTAEQRRSEIKLYVSKKKVVISPRELNEELKDRVSVLLSQKMNCDAAEARKLLEKSATDADLKKVVQRIDRRGEKYIAHSYTKDLVLSNEYQLLNI